MSFLRYFLYRKGYSTLDKASKSPSAAKGLFKLIIFGAAAFVIFIAVMSNVLDNSEETHANFAAIKEGDSLFVKWGSAYYNEFTRRELSQKEQKEIKYTKEDTISSTYAHIIDEKFFFQNKSTFVGICTGKDSTSFADKVWLKVEIPESIKEHLKIENPVFEPDFSKDFYFEASDVVNVNNYAEYTK